ncbi:MAG: hypothetical protein CL717_00855 [Chloroflexi bacterium]|nr:hypothetical protein [Chloroflexota bacterium]
MKKNFRYLSLFGVTTALLVAMLSSISAFAAPSGAITGTITVDKTWYSNVAAATNDVLVKVTDADANTTTAAVTNDVETLRAKASLVSTNIVLANTPIVGTPVACDSDTATDTLAKCIAASAQNIFVTSTATQPHSLVVANAAAGVITMTNLHGSATPNDGTVDADIYYNYSAVDYVKTTLKSTQEPNGNTIWLKETGKDTGIFTAKVDLSADAVATDYGTLKTIMSNVASGNLAAGAQSATLTGDVANMIFIDEAQFLAQPAGAQSATSLWCVRTAASSDDNCADGAANTYFPASMALVDNDGVGFPTFKITPVGVLNENVDVNVTVDDISACVSSTTAASNTCTDNGLKALNLNTITAEYSDATPTSGSTAVKVTDTASVETTGATFSGILPVTSTATQSTQPTISGTVTDTGGSGIDVSTVMINIDTDGNAAIAGGSEVDQATVVTGADGDNTVTWTYTATLAVNLDHNFYVEATDMAGNLTYSDATPAATGEDAAVGPNDTADWHQFKIDSTPATFSSAQTGKFWDTSLSTPAEGSDKNTSVVLIFNENIDGTTVQAADFLVDGVQPVTAFHTTSAKTKVYLELGAAIAADKKPVVKMGAAGAVSDLAGNTTNTGSVTAADKIAPTFTVTLDATLTKKNIVVTVSSDEPISGAPIINVGALKGGASTSVPVTNSNLSSQVATSTSWTGKYTAGATYEGKVGVVVTGNDMNGNSGTTGNNTMGAATLSADQCNAAHASYSSDCKFTSTKNIVFTSDMTMNDATYTSGNVSLSDTSPGANVTNTAPYVTATFDEAVTVTAATFDLKSATTPADVLAAGSLASDGKKWIYKAEGLTVGSEYKINLTYADAAGNEDKNIDAVLTIKAITDTSIPLNPGSNLVSMPVDPADTAINTVITSSAVSAVSTYDNGAWITATRSGDTLSGALSTIESGRAYWVTTTDFTPIKTAVVTQDAGDTPPTVAVEEGWNLLPVINITNTNASIGNSLTADTYFGSISWVTAYSYSPVTDVWSKITPNTFATVTVGAGYWVYADAAGTLVP